MMETLAQAMSRLDGDMRTLPGVQTFKALIEDETDFNVVSDIVEDVAKANDLYVGEKRWINRDTHFELRVGYAEDEEQYFRKYGNYRESLY